VTVASRQVETRSSPSPLRDQQEADFEAAFHQHYSRVYGVVFRLVGDRAEAEDLALETFWRLYERASADGADLNRGFNVGGWLYRVATNLGLNSIRAWKRRERYEMDACRLDTDNAGADPEDVVAAAEERHSVRQVLGEMNPRQAQLLVLRYSDLACREIAVALGVSPSSVGTLLARAEEEFERRYHDAPE